MLHDLRDDSGRSRRTAPTAPPRASNDFKVCWEGKWVGPEEEVEGTTLVSAEEVKHKETLDEPLPFVTWKVTWWNGASRSYTVDHFDDEDVEILSVVPRVTEAAKETKPTVAPRKKRTTADPGTPRKKKKKKKKKKRQQQPAPATPRAKPDAKGGDDFDMATLAPSEPELVPPPVKKEKKKMMKEVEPEDPPPFSKHHTLKIMIMHFASDKQKEVSLVHGVLKFWKELNLENASEAMAGQLVRATISGEDTRVRDSLIRALRNPVAKELKVRARARETDVGDRADVERLARKIRDYDDSAEAVARVRADFTIVIKPRFCDPEQKDAYYIDSKRPEAVLRSVPDVAAHLGLVEDNFNDVSCAFCGSKDQDDTMMLCEACNLPMHTTCFGIHTLPEDDWYCPGCADARVSPEWSEAAFAIKLLDVGSDVAPPASTPYADLSVDARVAALEALLRCACVAVPAFRARAAQRD